MEHICSVLIGMRFIKEDKQKEVESGQKGEEGQIKLLGINTNRVNNFYDWYYRDRINRSS